MSTILIIDDNPHHMELATMLLELNDYAVLKAGSAEEGIALAREHSPDLMLIDIELPGMDGLSAVRQLRADAATQALKIIVLTAYLDKFSNTEIMATGANAFLPKPYHHQDFLNLIRNLLERK